MAREVNAEKAKNDIIKLFKQENLKDERMNILFELIQSMSAPIEEKVSSKYEDIKKELEHYKKAAGSVVKEHVSKLMKEEKEQKNESPK